MGCCEWNCAKFTGVEDKKYDIKYDNYTCKVTTEYVHSLKGNNKQIDDLKNAYDNIEIKETFEDDN